MLLFGWCIVIANVLTVKMATGQLTKLIPLGVIVTMTPNGLIKYCNRNLALIQKEKG